jgi:tetratricopeptide (TPR) repeat protein
MFGGSSSPQALLQTGFQLLQQGRLEEAWNAYHEALRLDPNQALAHHMIGLIALQAGQFEIGVESLQRSIALNPGDSVAYGNLGNGLSQLGRSDEALTAYAKALVLNPAFLDALNNRAILLGRLGRHAEALADYDRALTAEPRAAFVHNNRAEALKGLGRTEEALASYDQAIALDPSGTDAIYNRANLEAELRLREAAETDYRRVISLRPDHLEAHVNLGNLLADLDRPAEALASYDLALAMRPDLPPALSNRADALRMLGRYDEALDTCGRAIALDPSFSDALINRAAVLFELARHREAADDFEAALRLDPGRAEAETHLGCALLALGDYQAGWARYEARSRITEERSRFVVDRAFGRTQWRGEEPLQGKTILLHSEQGLGDTLQFCRYASLAEAAGARVVLEAEKPLLPVLETLAGVETVVEKGTALPEFDLHCSLMSLPRAFRTSLETVPAAVPYLHADRDKVRSWAKRLGARGRPRVGLVWSGGFRADRPQLWALNRRRNIALELLAPLAAADADFYSLQKGQPAEGELAELQARGWDGPAITDFTADLHDFGDTAALIDNLDLVISVDTSTAHLAGAMGKPVWLLNRFDSCWRWMTDRADSPWYPTLRLFRQKRIGEWGPVVEDVARTLQDFRA